MCADAFGEGPAVVQIELLDQPQNKRRWWFLHDSGGVHLCVKDPGFEIGLYLAATLPDLLAIWRGALPLPAALRTGRLKAHGHSRYTHALQSWIGAGAPRQREQHRTPRHLTATAARHTPRRRL